MSSLYGPTVYPRRFSKSNTGDRHYRIARGYLSKLPTCTYVNLTSRTPGSSVTFCTIEHTVCPLTSSNEIKRVTWTLNHRPRGCNTLIHSRRLPPLATCLMIGVRGKKLKYRGFGVFPGPRKQACLRGVCPINLFEFMIRYDTLKQKQQKQEGGGVVFCLRPPRASSHSI